jgi:tripartite-type tricarboxylate transporter receptor subunit TctC
MNRRQLLLAAPAALLATKTLAADPWPSRPVRIIVPFPPGGPADGSARVLADSMGPALGANIVVENRAGGGGVIGITAAAQSNDGHTLLMGSTSMTVTPSMRTDLPYDILRDFQPIGMVSAQPLVLVVPAVSPLKNIEDVIRAGKKKGDLTAGTSGIGTLSHLAIELFNLRTGTEIVNVPYRGENAILPDLLNGTIGLGFLNLPILLPQLQAGKLRALAVSAKASIAELPDVKTFKAQGVDGLEVEGWAALLAAPAIPAEALPRVSEALRQALATSSVRQRLESFGTTPVSSTREELAAFLRAEMARWGEVVRTRNIKPE